MKNRILPRICNLTLVLCSLIIAVGCSKKEAAVAPVPPSAGETQNQAASPASAPVTQQASPAVIQEVQTALKAKNYDQATTLMINLQKSPQVTPEQAAAYANQMRQLQQNLAAAAASGDQNAIAAARRLGASRHH
jgi:hypothetical protein